MADEKKMPKLKELLNESIIVCPQAIEGTSPFGTKKPDNFTFKGLPGRIKENQKANLSDDQKSLNEDKFNESFKSLVESAGINPEEMYDLLIKFEGIDTRDAVNIAQALEAAVLKQTK